MITRAEADSQRLAARLAELGAIPVMVPAIAIEFADPALLDAALGRIRSYDWVIFTSRNAVEAVYRRAMELKGPRIAAVGTSTREGLRARGLEPDLVPAEQRAEGLLQAIGEVRNLRILFPRADIARRTLPEGLREKGAVVDEVVAYHTRPNESARPDVTGVDAVTFTSSSTVRNFLEGGPVPAGAKVVCIGPVTAETARECGLEVTEVAGDYSEDGLIAALVAALGR